MLYKIKPIYNKLLTMSNCVKCSFDLPSTRHCIQGDKFVKVKSNVKSFLNRALYRQ